MSGTKILYHVVEQALFVVVYGRGGRRWTACALRRRRVTPENWPTTQHGRFAERMPHTAWWVHDAAAREWGAVAMVRVQGHVVGRRCWLGSRATTMGKQESILQSTNIIQYQLVEVNWTIIFLFFPLHTVNLSREIEVNWRDLNAAADLGFNRSWQ